MKRLRWAVGLAALSVAGVGVLTGAVWTPLAVVDDPLVRMPGTQPGQGVNLEGPNRCLNCHAGYDATVEPGFNWKGSMMAQAARDPIFWACLTVAAQDSIWAVDRPNATDLCLRCHFPAGWLGGRSDPTNAELMAGDDFDGIQCDFCHRMWDPFCTDTYAGVREGNDWQGYWDEFANTGPGSGTLSQTEAAKTLNEDNLVLRPGIRLMSGGAFFAGAAPVYATYSESAGGQYFVSGNSQKRASFADAAARHQMLYSRYHKSKYFCATCHDVSNPALANLLTPLPDQSGGTALISEQYPAYAYFHVERTFSEFMLSAYGQQGGAPTNPELRDQGAFAVMTAAKCQDCHMRDMRGAGADKNGAPIRPDGSTEHPNSGQPVHDLTGGNLWISHILASLDPGGPVYDPVNAQLLGQGPAVLTLDLTAGETPVANGAALKDGAERAALQLRLAAALKDLTYNPTTGVVSLRILNNTAHKLISGFPEGRRMFLNIKAFVGDQVAYEVNPYDYTVGTLKGLPTAPDSPPPAAGETYVDELVYEIHPRSDLTGEDETFHFVLATGRYKDNRIPPKGFNIAAAPARLAEPVWHGESRPDYFTAEEYAGGYDRVELTLPPGAERIVATLYYQGTSREYVKFLRDEINGIATTLPPEAYIIQTDTSGFFDALKAWGDTIWNLWRHNHGLDGSGVQLAGIVPFTMATAEYVSPEPEPLQVAASLDWAWVYQNTAATTLDRHKAVLTVTITGGDLPGADYAVALGENGGALQNFLAQPTADPLIVNVLGGRIGSSTPSAPASRTLNVTVLDQTYGRSASADVGLALRVIGDITGDGHLNALDKAHMTAWLNGVPLSGDTVRHLDLNGDGNVNAIDKVLLTRQLNGLGIL